MSYQVWTKDEFEGWKRKDCEDLAAVQEAVMEAIRGNKDALITVEVPFEVNIKIKEVKQGEVTKIKAEPGESTGAKGKGKVRPGATRAVSELSEGSRDPGAGNSVQS